MVDTVCACKPNLAFYLARGSAGIDDLVETVAAIPLVVAWLRSQGYSFVTVDQLLTGGYGPPATGFDRRGGNVLA